METKPIDAMKRRMAEQRAAMDARFKRTVSGGPGTDIGDISVRGLQELEHMDSMIRHSVVEICFQNLKLNAQLFSKEDPLSDRADAAWQRLANEFNELPAVRDKLARHFSARVDGGIAVRDVFAEVEDTVMSAIDTVLGGAPAGLGTIKGDDRDRTGESIVAAVDEIMGVLGTVRPPLDQSKFEITALIQDLSESLAAYCDGNNIDLSVDVSDGSCRVFADAELLKDAISELVRNAAKHAGSERKRNRVRIVFREESKEGRWAVISVDDSGCGMTKHELAQARDRTVIDSHGGGHGLPMIHRTVEDIHNGRVEIKRSNLGGMRFEIWLPSKFHDTR